MELAEAVCEQLGYTPVFQYIVWDKKDEYLDNGRMSISGLAHTFTADR